MAAKRPSRRRRRSLLGDDLDLTAIMNLFMILIPFLLLSAVFARTVSIDIILPSGAGSSTGAPEEPLTVTMQKNGLRLGGLGKGMPFIEKKKGKQDYDTLTKHLLTIKSKYPAKEDIVLMFSKGTPYEDVVKLMDASRETTVTEGETSVRKVLFPYVSVGESSEGAEK